MAGTTFELELPNEFRKRGIHPRFHAKLLCPHIPNDNHRFPGRALSQMMDAGNKENEWLVDKIISHNGKGSQATFEVRWKSGDTTWMDYPSIRHLTAFDNYFELKP